MLLKEGFTEGTFEIEPKPFTLADGPTVAEKKLLLTTGVLPLLRTLRGTELTPTAYNLEER